MLTVTRSVTEIMHNTKIKSYPDGLTKITVASRNVFREKGWEPSEELFSAAKIPKPQSKDNEVRPDSQKRAKDNIFDIIAMNREKFTYFVTLTFDPEQVNSKSAKEVKKLVQRFLKNKVSRDGLVYIFIPELHKDGKIHLHGLTNGTLKFVDSGTRKA